MDSERKLQFDGFNETFEYYFDYIRTKVIIVLFHFNVLKLLFCLIIKEVDILYNSVPINDKILLISNYFPLIFVDPMTMIAGARYPSNNIFVASGSFYIFDLDVSHLKKSILKT